ncbi:hypothetical protein P3T76_009763 [Phytophthora citrophthora]|uniref:RxLR effector protein n=1 Tax=Phytophthora citrophthora TaxID=4793 RepID=A0AAD9GEH1_9STRA|nr:hypothetical protein P3T76_009763 [Phytophthora citrophthora]
MRLSYVLLVVATTVTFMPSMNAAAVADDTNRSATFASMDSGGKRSLRYHNNDDALLEEENEADEEERKGTNMFSVEKLDEMLDGTKVMSRFKKWKANHYNTYNLPAVVQDSKYDELRKLYFKYLYRNKFPTS